MIEGQSKRHKTIRHRHRKHKVSVAAAVPTCPSPFQCLGACCFHESLQQEAQRHRPSSRPLTPMSLGSAASSVASALHSPHASDSDSDVPPDTPKTLQTSKSGRSWWEKVSLSTKDASIVSPTGSARSGGTSASEGEVSGEEKSSARGSQSSKGSKSSKHSKGSKRSKSSKGSKHSGSGKGSGDDGSQDEDWLGGTSDDGESTGTLKRENTMMRMVNEEWAGAEEVLELNKKKKGKGIDLGLGTPEDPQLMAFIRGHVDVVTTIHFDESANRLVTSSNDMTAKLWQLRMFGEWLLLP